MVTLIVVEQVDPLDPISSLAARVTRLERYATWERTPSDAPEAEEDGGAEGRLRHQVRLLEAELRSLALILDPLGPHDNAPMNATQTIRMATLKRLVSHSEQLARVGRYRCAFCGVDLGERTRPDLDHLQTCDSNPLVVLLRHQADEISALKRAAGGPRGANG